MRSKLSNIFNLNSKCDTKAFCPPDEVHCTVAVEGVAGEVVVAAAVVAADTAGALY